MVTLETGVESLCPNLVLAQQNTQQQQHNLAGSAAYSAQDTRERDPQHDCCTGVSIGILQNVTYDHNVTQSLHGLSTAVSLQSKPQNCVLAINCQHCYTSMHCSQQKP